MTTLLHSHEEKPKQLVGAAFQQLLFDMEGRHSEAVICCRIWRAITAV